MRERIQKVLFRQGVASQREAEKFIKQGSFKELTKREVESIGLQ